MPEPSAPSTDPRRDDGFRRVLGPVEAASLVAGSMVGGLLADKILHLHSWLGRSALSIACAAAVVALLSPKHGAD